MRVPFALLSGLLMAVCGCSHNRIQWKYQDADLQKNPVTKQRYSIKAMRYSPCGQNAHEAVFGSNLAQESFLKNWVDHLYELYPGVFAADGVPVVIHLGWMKEDAPPKGYERTGFDKFMYFLGAITLSVIPLNDVNYYRWEMSVETDAGRRLGSRNVDKVHEELFSLFPLGLFCYFSKSDYGDYQLSYSIYDNHLGSITKLQMEALGAGIAAELIAMEKDERIKVGGKGEAAVADLQLAEKQYERSRILAEERKKNLDSLLKSGVITEEEYKREIGKEAK